MSIVSVIEMIHVSFAEQLISVVGGFNWRPNFLRIVPLSLFVDGVLIFYSFDIDIKFRNVLAAIKIARGNDLLKFNDDN